MKAHELQFESMERLDELAMNPSSLRKMAAGTGAVAGMEFEMVVPEDVYYDPDEMEMVKDMSEDRYPKSIEDVCNFYYNPDYNSKREIEELRENLKEEYLEWLDKKLSETFKRDQQAIVERYIREHEIDFEDMIMSELEDMGLTDQEIKVALRAGKEEERSDDVEQDDLFGGKNEAYENFKKAKKLANDNMYDMVNESIRKKDRYWQTAFENFKEDIKDDFPEDGWFDDVGLDKLSDFEGRYEITWPYWTDEFQSNGSDMAGVALSFKGAINRPVKYSDQYHGQSKDDTSYFIEPDSSISPGTKGGSGLEFVSPPLPIDQMITDLNKVIEWAHDNNCYTNSSTGLHMNISIPGVDQRNLDYVKLVLLSGDNYVLEQFGREANTYAASALSNIKRYAERDPENIEEIMKKMKNGLNHLASRSIHGLSTDKYTSINIKGKYIEVRAPGGDWLRSDVSRLENTLLRYVVAYDAACSPEKYRKDYLKKLYTLLNVKNKDDILSFFADFAAGKMDKKSLLHALKYIRRDIKPYSKQQVKKPVGTEPRSIEPTRAGSQEFAIYSNVDPDTIVATFWARENDPRSSDQAYGSTMRRLGKNQEDYYYTLKNR